MPESDQPLTEAELAQMFVEEGRQPPEEPQSTEKPLDVVLDPEPETPVETVIDPEPGPQIPPEKRRPEDPDPTQEPEPIELPAEVPDPDLEPESFEQAEHLAWAERRNLTSFDEAAKLAYEQERFLGKRATEVTELREQLREAEARAEQATADSPPLRSDEWIASVLTSPDPGRFAWDLARGGEWETYQALMEGWEQIVGQTATMNVHRQITAQLEAEQGQALEPEAAPADAAERVREAFALAGIFDLDTHPLRETIIQVADEMGGAHPLVQGAAQGDVLAVQAIVEIARSRTLTTRTLRMDGSEVTPVDPAQAISGNGAAPSREPAKPDPFAKLDDEWRRMGALPSE